MADIVLVVAGAEYAGWEEIHVGRSLEAVAGAFTAQVSDRWPSSPPPHPIVPGSPCTVAIDGETVLTGYVDDVQIRYDAESHSLTLAGRDKTADLVDCSAVASPGEWSGRTLTQIAAELAKPFGVEVVGQDADVGAPFDRFGIEEGETVYEAIERMCRMRAVLPTTDGLGRLVLTRAGTGRAGAWLKRKDNILAGQAQLSLLQRFSDYIVKSQRPPGGATGADPFEGGTAAAVTAAAQVIERAKDADCPRYRPLVVLAEEPTDGQNATGRAQWEAVVRAARARRLSYFVQGFHEQSDQGPLWAINRLVEVRDDWMGVVGVDMLIVEAQFHMDSQGRRTELMLMPEGAFYLAGEKGTRVKHHGRKKADGGDVDAIWR